MQTTQKHQEFGRMLYNELEQGDILSGVRFGLALLAYTDILLCSIWVIHSIRQTPVGNTKGVRPWPCPLQNRLSWGHCTRFWGPNNLIEVNPRLCRGTLKV